MNEEQGLKNVIDYIEAHIRESLSAEEIASACYYSRSNTKALFKKVFQYGMMEYAARRKLTQAAGELLSTSQSVCEIALEYGFASQEVFTRAFKKMWQETPARFRKRRRFWQLFPRQDFFCDDCGVFRRRFCLEDMRKMLEHREHTWIVCFDMEAPGIRYLKTVFGGEGGERFVLDCLQRIEGEMREGDHLFRIAGDKFVLLASSEAYETVLDQAERVFRRNGEKVHYQGNAVELAMFGGLIRLDQGDARSERLFEKLDGVLGRRWELTKRRRVQEDTDKRGSRGSCRFVYPEQGFPTGTVYHGYEIWKNELWDTDGTDSDRFWGYGADIKREREHLSFPLMCMKEENDRFEQNAPQIFWKLDQPGGRMLFPKGENWCVFQVMGSEGLVVREHFMVICGLKAEKTADGFTLSFEKLFLEAVRTKNGSWLRLNEGELKETVHDLGLGAEEYRKICRTEREIRTRFKNSPLFQTKLP